MSKVTQLVDKVKVLINPELAGKGGKILKGIGLGAALGTGAGAAAGLGGGLLAASRLPKSDHVLSQLANALATSGYVLGGTAVGTGAGLVGGAAIGGGLGYAAKRAAIAKAKDAQKKVLLGAAGVGGAGAIGGGVYYLGNKK